MTAPLTDARLEEIRAMLAARPEYFNPGTHDLLAELDRLKARRCEMCQHSFVGMAPAGRPHYRYCKLTKQPADAFSSFYTECATLGNGCNAWEAK